MEKIVGRFYLKNDPPSPNEIPPTLTDEGGGKDYGKNKNLCFIFEQCYTSFSIFSGKYGDSFNTLHKVCQQLFAHDCSRCQISKAFLFAA